MKSILLKSVKYPDLVAQMFNGKISSLGENEAKEGMWIENPEWIYEIYKLLKEVDKRGGFIAQKMAENDGQEPDPDQEIIYV